MEKQFKKYQIIYANLPWYYINHINFMNYGGKNKCQTIG